MVNAHFLAATDILRNVFELEADSPLELALIKEHLMQIDSWLYLSAYDLIRLTYVNPVTGSDMLVPVDNLNCLWSFICHVLHVLDTGKDLEYDGSNLTLDQFQRWNSTPECNRSMLSFAMITQSRVETTIIQQSPTTKTFANILSATPMTQEPVLNDDISVDISESSQKDAESDSEISQTVLDHLADKIQSLSFAQSSTEIDEMDISHFNNDDLSSAHSEDEGHEVRNNVSRDIDSKLCAALFTVTPRRMSAISETSANNSDSMQPIELISGIDSNSSCGIKSCDSIDYLTPPEVEMIELNPKFDQQDHKNMTIPTFIGETNDYSEEEIIFTTDPVRSLNIFQEAFSEEFLSNCSFLHGPPCAFNYIKSISQSTLSLSATFNDPTSGTSSHNDIVSVSYTTLAIDEISTSDVHEANCNAIDLLDACERGENYNDYVAHQDYVLLDDCERGISFVSSDDTETQTPILPLIILNNIVEDSSKEQDMLDECEYIHQNHQYVFPTTQWRHFATLVDDLCYLGPCLLSSVPVPNVRSVQLDGEMPHPRKHVKFRKPSSSNDMMTENGIEVQPSLSEMTNQCQPTTQDSKPTDSDLANNAIAQTSNDFGIQMATTETNELGEINVHHDDIDIASATTTELITQTAFELNLDLFYQLEWQRSLHFIMAQSGWKLALVEASNYSSLCSQHPADGLLLLCSPRKHVKFRNEFAFAVPTNDTSVNSVQLPTSTQLSKCQRTTCQVPHMSAIVRTNGELHSSHTWTCTWKTRHAQHLLILFRNIMMPLTIFQVVTHPNMLKLKSALETLEFERNSDQLKGYDILFVTSLFSMKFSAEGIRQPCVHLFWIIHALLRPVLVLFCPLFKAMSQHLFHNLYSAPTTAADVTMMPCASQSTPPDMSSDILILLHQLCKQVHSARKQRRREQIMSQDTALPRHQPSYFCTKVNVDLRMNLSTILAVQLSMVIRHCTKPPNPYLELCLPSSLSDHKVIAPLPTLQAAAQDHGERHHKHVKFKTLSLSSSLFMIVVSILCWSGLLVQAKLPTAHGVEHAARPPPAPDPEFVKFIMPLCLYQTSCPYVFTYRHDSAKGSRMDPPEPPDDYPICWRVSREKEKSNCNVAMVFKREELQRRLCSERRGVSGFHQLESRVPPSRVAYRLLVLFGLYPHRPLVPDSLDCVIGSSRYETWTWIFPPKSRVNWTNDRSYCLVTESGQKSVARGCWSSGTVQWHIGLVVDVLVDAFDRLKSISVGIARNLSTLGC